VSPATRRWSAVGATLAGSLAGWLLIQPPVPVVFALQSAALLLVVLVAMHYYRDRDHPSGHHRIDEHLVVFVGVLLSAGAIALGHEQLFAAPTFDTADIRLTDGITVEGGYITTTDTAVLLITRRSGDCPTITALRRDRIEQARIGPTSIEVEVEDSEFCTRTLDGRDFP
jgi:hypothetical protein